MIMLHIDWQDEDDADQIFEILKARILKKNKDVWNEKQASSKIYQIFPDHEGGIGFFCDATDEDYLESISCYSPRYDYVVGEYGDF